MQSFCLICPVFKISVLKKTKFNGILFVRLTVLKKSVFYFILALLKEMLTLFKCHFLEGLAWLFHPSQGMNFANKIICSTTAQCLPLFLSLYQRERPRLNLICMSMFPSCTACFPLDRKVSGEF